MKTECMEKLPNPRWRAGWRCSCSNGPKEMPRMAGPVPLRETTAGSHWQEQAHGPGPGLDKKPMHRAGLSSIMAMGTGHARALAQHRPRAKVFHRYGWAGGQHPAGQAEAEGPGLGSQRAPGPVAVGRQRLGQVRLGGAPRAGPAALGGPRGDMEAYSKLWAWAPWPPDKMTVLRFFYFCFLDYYISSFAILFFLHYFHWFAALCKDHFLVDFLKLIPLFELIGPQEDVAHLWEPQLP